MDNYKNVFEQNFFFWVSQLSMPDNRFFQTSIKNFFVQKIGFLDKHKKFFGQKFLFFSGSGEWVR